MTLNTPFGLGKLFALIGCALSVVSGSATTLHTIPLAWNASPESGITGYKIYVGSASEQYDQVLDAGTNLSMSVTNMEYGKTYYFAVTAIGSTGLESLLSPELVVTIAPPPLPSGVEVSANGSGQAGLSWSYPVSDISSSLQFMVESSSDLVEWTQEAAVLPTASTGGNSQTAQFSWPFAMTDVCKFYRLSVKNWMDTYTE